jgi:hypothetical protein
MRQWLAAITGTPPHINFKHVDDPNLTPPRVLHDPGVRLDQDGYAYAE